jgi:hypothetical protein
MSTKDAEALTDFKRKRRNTALKRRLAAAPAKVPPAR